MALHPCGSCGDEAFAATLRMSPADGSIVTRYVGPCRTCHAERDFRFRIDDEGASPPLAAGEPEFGRTEPSGLIDAGQWLRCADRILAATPSSVLGVSEEEWRERRYLFKAAAESVAEVLKFVPDGADAVPERSFWTDDGRAERDRAPDRFRRDTLEHLRLACLELASRFAT